jgi:ribose 5-phosphate isomerase A
VTPKLELIKGMGGALTREKIVAKASKKNIIIADETKKVKVLGQQDQPVPIEIVPFATSLVIRAVRTIGGKPILRESHGKLGPVVTDNGNFIIDAIFGPIPDPQKLEQKLKALTGVVETGLFIGTADIAYIGTRSQVEKISR